MTPFEYIMPLVSVLVGLAIADLAVSFNRLLRARDRVQWNWLPLLTAFMAILAVLDIWWVFYGEQQADFYQTLAGFLPIVAQLILLYLINAAALPDDVPPEGMDLKEFYEENSPYFWTLFVIYFASAFVTHIVSNFHSDGDSIHILQDTLWNLAIVVFLGSLIFVKNKRYHAAVIIAFLVFYMSQGSFRSLETIQR